MSEFEFLSIITKFDKIKVMKKTSISLGEYFEEFVNNEISAGRYKNESEVLRAGLQLLENEETKVAVLKNEIQKGLNSPRIENFDLDDNIKKLKAERMSNG